MGQGLAGSALAWELLERGKRIVVFDQPDANKASIVAAGLFNPVTGRVMSLTWRASELFPVLHAFYANAEKALEKKFLHDIPVYRPFLTAEECKSWAQKAQQPELKRFVRSISSTPVFTDQVINPFGGIEVNQSGYVDIRAWLTEVRGALIRKACYEVAAFAEEELSFQNGIIYKDYQADRIIFCQGIDALQSRWWSWLPLRKLKGETLDIEIPMRLQRLFNRGVYVVPRGGSRYTAGATYQHPPFEEGISQSGRTELESALTQLIPGRISVINQSWGIRPTTPDRRPLLGAHPSNKSLIIFNGLGTKGVSLAPYLARVMAAWLEGTATLPEEVNIERFKSLYSK